MKKALLLLSALALLAGCGAPAEADSAPPPEVIACPAGQRKLEGAPPQALSLSQAREMAPHGSYLPAAPEGFQLESAAYDQEEDRLSLLWTRPGAYDELRWSVFPYQDSLFPRLTAVSALENYDLSRYPIPRADSVPEELREIVDRPIFNGAELTLEAVQRRAYTVEDSGDSQGPRLSFGVRYGDMVVELSAKGVDPAWVYQQLQQIEGA